MHIAEETWPEADAVNAEVALLPVGSTEQHGPHAPLSTDTIAAESVAEAGAEKAHEAVVVAPAVPYGISAEHRTFAGTLWLTPDTFRAAVGDLIESLASHGWERVVLVNGHGGNTDALQEVAAMVTRNGVANVVAFTWFDAIDSDELGHAGALETSMVMDREPNFLKRDRLEDARTNGSDGWGRWVSGTNVAHDSDEFTENGVVGDPTGATADRGAELRAQAGLALAALIDAI